MSRESRTGRRGANARLFAISTMTAAVVAGGGTMWAAAMGDGDVIHACVNTGASNIGEGQVRIVDDPASCRPNETSIQWNQQGPQGEQGPPGPAGTARAYASVYPAGLEGGPFLRSESKGFAKVFYERVGFLELYCLVPEPGLSPYDTVLVVSLGNNGGGGFAPGHDVGHAGVCLDPETGRAGWQVGTWGPDGEPNDEVSFTALVP